MLDLCCCHRTVFVERESSRWLLSSAVTFAAVLWFLGIILLNEWWSPSLSFGFWPLFLSANDVYPWFVYAIKTLETGVLGAPNTVAILVTDTTAERTPTVSSLKNLTVFPFCISLIWTVIIIIIIIIIFQLRTAAFKAYCAILVRRSNFSHQASPRMSPRESTQPRKVELWARNVR
jgi:hypothetical protein